MYITHYTMNKKYSVFCYYYLPLFILKDTNLITFSLLTQENPPIRCIELVKFPDNTVQ
jgi:hypothetical protein